MKIMLLLCAWTYLLSLQMYGQWAWQASVGTNYAWTQIERRPTNVIPIFVEPVNPMYSSVIELHTHYTVNNLLRLRIGSGYTSMGYTDNFFQQRVFHYVPLTGDVMIHARRAPVWLQNLWLGGGGNLKLALNRPRQTLARFSEVIRDPRWVGGVHAQLVYHFASDWLVGARYEHLLTPYTIRYFFTGQVENRFFNRALFVTLGYQFPK
jgi:hypothetical protein